MSYDERRCYPRASCRLPPAAGRLLPASCLLPSACCFLLRGRSGSTELDFGVYFKLFVVLVGDDLAHTHLTFAGKHVAEYQALVAHGPYRKPVLVVDHLTNRLKARIAVGA